MSGQPDIDTALKRVANNTLKSRTPRAIDNVRRNMERLNEIPAITGGQPWRGRVAACVGAGPSLSRNGRTLGKLQSKGHIVVAVNSALGALDRLGIRPDVVVAVEPLGEPSQLRRGRYGTLVVDWQASPELFRCGDVWITPPGPAYLGLARTLRAHPVTHGGFATSLAVGLSVCMGAEELALVGVDLSHDVLWGQTYAEGAPWAESRVEQDGGSLTWSGAEERDMMRTAKGGPPMPRKLRSVELTAWGGDGTAIGDVTFEVQRRWLAGRAQEMDDGPRMTNATEGGARIEGWHEERLSAVADRVQPMPPPASIEGPVVHAQRLQRAREQVAHEGGVMAELSRQMPTRSRIDPRLWEELAKGIPYTQARAACDIIPLFSEPGMSPVAKFRGGYEISRQAALWAQKAWPLEQDE